MKSFDLFVPRRDERVCVCVGGCWDLQSPFHFHPHTHTHVFCIMATLTCNFGFTFQLCSHLYVCLSVYVYVPVTHFFTHYTCYCLPAFHPPPNFYQLNIWQQHQATNRKIINSAIPVRNFEPNHFVVTHISLNTHTQTQRGNLMQRGLIGRPLRIINYYIRHMKLERVR